MPMMAMTTSSSMRVNAAMCLGEWALFISDDFQCIKRTTDWPFLWKTFSPVSRRLESRGFIPGSCLRVNFGTLIDKLFRLFLQHFRTASSSENPCSAVYFPTSSGIFLLQKCALLNASSRNLVTDWHFARSAARTATYRRHRDLNL